MNSQVFELVNRQDIGRERWDAFVDSSDEAWLWHRFDLQDALSTWPGRSDLSFAILDAAAGGQIAAVIPLHLIKGRVARLFSWNVLDSLGGPACGNDLGDRHKRKILEYIYEQLIALARQYSAVEINLALSPMAPAFCGDRCPRVNPLLGLSCENTLTQTWVVDLRPGTDTLWQGMEGRARTAIRKAEKMGVKARMANQPGDLDIYYRLHCETYQRTGVRPHPRAYFEAIWTDLLTAGLAHILFAECAGEVVAAENFSVYKQAAIYWTGAASSQGLSTSADSLLQWAGMRWMVEKEIAWYETGEAFPGVKEGKLKGLNDFKKSFGGELYPFYRGRINNNRKKYEFIRILSRLYGIFREYKS